MRGSSLILSSPLGQGVFLRLHPSPPFASSSLSAFASRQEGVGGGGGDSAFVSTSCTQGGGRGQDLLHLLLPLLIGCKAGESFPLVLGGQEGC